MFHDERSNQSRESFFLREQLISVTLDRSTRLLCAWRTIYNIARQNINCCTVNLEIRRTIQIEQRVTKIMRNYEKKLSNHDRKVTFYSCFPVVLTLSWFSVLPGSELLCTSRAIRINDVYHVPLITNEISYPSRDCVIKKAYCVVLHCAARRIFVADLAMGEREGWGEQIN